MSKLETFLSVFEDKKKAYKVLLSINSKYNLAGRIAESIDSLHEALEECADADLAFSYFERFLENSTAKSTIFEILKGSRTACNLLFGILSQSNTLSLTLINHSEYFYWLIEDSLYIFKNKNDFYKEIMELINKRKTLDEKKFFLREHKKKEYLRIGAKEIANVVQKIEIYNELSELADAVLEISLNLALQSENLKPDNMCIIGLGKLGAKELNFSSDIDIMFVHKQNELTEQACKVASKVVSMISDVQFGSFVFRVDTRLRPFGNNSSLSLSLEEYENYYYSFGQIWEKFALSRARFCAGSLDIANKFFKIVKPFVYQKNVDIEYIESVRSIRHKIREHKLTNNQKSVVIDPLKINVKLGIGGIREIEFIVQYFQLIYAGKDSQLQQPSTLGVLDILHRKNYLKEAQNLKDIYLFFRLIEHKLQLENEQQTYLLPPDYRNFAKLSKKLNLTTEEFIKTYNNYTTQVHALYKSIFYTNKISIFSPIENIESYFAEEFSNYKQIANLISGIARKSKFADINESILDRAFNAIYEKFELMTNPLKQIMFENVIIGINKLLPSYYETFFTNPHLLDLLTKAFAIGLHEKISQQPSLIDEFFWVAQELEILELTPQEKHRIEFNVALKTLSNKLNKTSKTILSEFAINYIAKLIAQVGLTDILVLGYGKLGIGELFINSDLDIVFISKTLEDKKISLVSKLTAELSKLYNVDLRLRPFGDKGLILCDLDFFISYLQKYAKDWEKLAIQKSRIIYADFEHNLEKHIMSFLASVNKESIKEMKMLIEKHKGFDIKNAKGGITDIEFIIQYLCIQKNCYTYPLSILDMANELIKIDKTKKIAAQLKGIYIYFSHILNITRLTNNTIKDKTAILEFVCNDNVSTRLEKLRQKVIIIFNNIF